MRDRLSRLYDEGLNLIPFRGKNKPLVSDYDSYFDSKNRVSLEELVKHYENGNTINIIAGLQPNGRYLIIFDLENEALKHGKGLSIQQVFEAFKIIARYCKISTLTITSKSMNNGLHLFYYLSDMLSEDYKNKRFDKIGIELILRRQSATILSRDLDYYNEVIEIIDIEQQSKFIEVAELLNNLVGAVKDYYIKGSRDQICLALAGYLRRSGYDEELAKAIIECICIVFADEERNYRIKQCVEQTYKQEVDKVSGYKLAKSINEELANRLNNVFNYKPERDKANSLLAKIRDIYNNYPTPYSFVENLLASDLEEGNEDCRFMSDYVYVMHRYASRDERKGNWYKWIGYKWQECNYNEVAKELHAYFIKKIELLEECKESEIARLKNDDERRAVENLYSKIKGLIVEAISSGSTRNELLNTIEKSNLFSKYHIFEDQLDKMPEDRYLINTKSALIVIEPSQSLSNLEYKINVIKHGEDTKRYYLTKSFNVEYDPSARSDKFDDFLNEIMEGDRELATFLCTMFGLAMIPRRVEKAFILYGAGRNGKTTLLQTMMDIFGDYARDSHISLINSQEEEGKNPEFVACSDKHLVIIDDPHRTTINFLSLKEIISHGKKSARTLNARPQEYEKKFTLVIATNNKPSINDHTEGTYRKLCYIPFEHNIARDNIIENYHLVLLRERNGIFNRLLEGLLRYLNAKNFEVLVPEKVKRYTLGVIWEEDHVKEFADNYLEEANGINTPFAEIYAKYQEFCKLKSIEEPLSSKGFSLALEKKGYYSIKIGRITYKKNCRLKIGSYEFE